MPRPFHPILAVWLALAMPGLAAPGDLDPTWGGTGKVLTNPTPDQDICNAIVRQSDGRIVAVGGSAGNTAVMRYQLDGQLDPTFSGDGMTRPDLGGGNLPDLADAVALDALGRIVVAGFGIGNFGFDTLVARFLSDGTLDPTFGTGGKVVTAISTSDDWARAVAMQGDGKIVVAGFTTISGRRQVCVSRYLEDGTLDPAFNGTGRFISALGERETQALDIALQPDGKIVVVGSVTGTDFNERMLVLRLLTDGTVDATFHAVGFVSTFFTGLDVANGVALLPDGRIVVAGTVGGPNNSQFGLARYLPDGTPDGTFNGTGATTTSFSIGPQAGAEALTVQEDGRAVAIGFARPAAGSAQFAVARYLRDGSLDPTFGSAGRVTTAVPNGAIPSAFAYDVALMEQERILVAGVGGFASNGLGAFALVRYEDGAPLAPLVQWKLAQLGDANAPDLDDGEGDGLAHLAEYGLVLSPTAYSPVPGANAFAYPDGTRLRLFFNRDPARNDVSIEVRAAGDPAGPWTTIASSVLGGVTTGAGYVGGDGAGPGVKTVEVRDVVKISDAAQRYLRLRVSVGAPPAAPVMAPPKISAPKPRAKMRR